MTPVSSSPSVLLSLPAEASLGTVFADLGASQPAAAAVEPPIEVSAEAVTFVALDLLRNTGVVNSVVVDLLGLSTTPVELDVAGEFADPDTLAIFEALSTPDDELGEAPPADDLSSMMAVGLVDLTGDVVITVVVDSLTGEIPAVGVDYDLVIEPLMTAASASDALAYQIPDELIATYAVVDDRPFPETSIFIVGSPSAKAAPGVDVPLFSMPQLGPIAMAPSTFTPTDPAPVA